MSYPTSANCTYFYVVGTGYFLAPVTSVSGVPGGMTYNAGAQTVTGSPTTIGITDGFINGLPWRAIVCSGAHAPTITSPLDYYLSQGVPSTIVLTAVIAFDGTDPITWMKKSDLIPQACAVSVENLPPGLVLNGDGSITGTPTTVGTYTCRVLAVDAGNTPNDGIADLVITVLAASDLAIACGAPPDGEIGVAYSHSFPATGGDLPYTFAITSGALPDGLTLDTATGEASGTPTTIGVFSFRVEVTDANLVSAHADCSITINPHSTPTDLQIACGNPPVATVGTFYTHTFPVSGGTAPFSFTVLSGALPTGLHLDTLLGILSGTPTASGSFSYVIEVTDADGNTADTTDCSLDVAPFIRNTTSPVIIPVTVKNALPIPLPDPSKPPC